jgi:hypothetical protein
MVNSQVDVPTEVTIALELDTLKWRGGKDVQAPRSFYSKIFALTSSRAIPAASVAAGNW